MSYDDSASCHSLIFGRNEVFGSKSHEDFATRVGRIIQNRNVLLFRKLEKLNSFSLPAYDPRVSKSGKDMERSSPAFSTKRGLFRETETLIFSGLRKESSNAHRAAFDRKLKMDKKNYTILYHIKPYYTIFMQFSYHLYHVYTIFGWFFTSINRNERRPQVVRSEGCAMEDLQGSRSGDQGNIKSCYYGVGDG